MSKIEWAFVFAVQDEPYKWECFFCGEAFTPYPLSIALDARYGDEEEERILSDEACSMCPSCILKTPRDVASLARKNAERVVQRAERISRKKNYDRTQKEESNMEVAPSYSRDLHSLAGALEKMPDFSKIPDFALAAHIARFNGEQKGNPSRKRKSPKVQAGKAA